MQSNQNSRGKDLPAPTGCSSLILMDANMRDSLTYSLLRRCLQCVSLVSKFSCNNIVGTFNWITYTLLPRSFCRFPQELYQLLLLQFHHPTLPTVVYLCLTGRETTFRFREQHGKWIYPICQPRETKSSSLFIVQSSWCSASLAAKCYPSQYFLFIPTKREKKKKKKVQRNILAISHSYYERRRISPKVYRRSRYTSNAKTTILWREKEKKRKGGDDDDDDPDGKTAVSTQSLVDGRHRYKCMHTATARFTLFQCTAGGKRFFVGGAYSSPHIISAQGEGADPIVLLFSSFSINRHHSGCVCVCVAPVLPLPHQLLCIQVSFYPSWILISQLGNGQSSFTGEIAGGI